MTGAKFAAQKAIGTAAEIALRDLIVAAGGIVTTNQVNRDLVQDHPGAAVAHVQHRTCHLPDLSVLWPAHPVRRFGMESKAKSPLGMGGWGWDIRAFDRAARWSELTGDPVFYTIRDISTDALPALGEPDNVDRWHIASVWRLMHSPHRWTDERYHYWPAADFTPLVVLLECGSDITTAVVPVIHLGDGRPPLVL